MTSNRSRCCVLIPCLNEARAIGELLQSVLAQGLPVIVVDDGSDDGTDAIVARHPVTLVRHETRRGKGEALRTGFREALRQGHEAVISMDGDGQHSAEDIPRLLAAAQRYPNHIVVGARLIRRAQQPLYRRLANDFADWGISWACGQRIIDTQSGQRYYPRGVLDLVDVATEGFVFESEILIEAAWKRDVRVVAVPIESRYRSEFRLSHFRPLRDFTGITVHVVTKAARAGFVLGNLRRARSEPALIFDPDGHKLHADAEHVGADSAA